MEVSRDRQENPTDPDQTGEPPARPSPKTSGVRAVALALMLMAGVGSILVGGPFPRTEDQRARRAGADVRRSISLVIAPFYGSATDPAELAPLCRYLEKKVGVRLEPSRAATYADAAEAVTGDSVTIGILPALVWVKTQERQHRLRLLALQSFEDSYASDSLLVVRAEGDLRELSQLRGGEICYVDPASASGHLLARSWVRSQGADPANFFARTRWSGDQLTALRDLSERRCDVAAISANTLRIAEEHGESPEAFRVLAITGHLPGAVWAGSPRLDDSLAEDITAALKSFDPQEALGEPWLGRTLRIGGFRAGNRSSYRAVWAAAHLEGLLR